VLEQAFPELGRVTYGEFKQSSKPGKISVKARVVPSEKRTKFGFPKGGYKGPGEPDADASLNDTALREVYEETSLRLEPLRLIDTDYISTGPRGERYAIFHYKLTEAEYKNIKENDIFVKKNAQRENELQAVQFIRIPQISDNFFTNLVSNKAYTHTHGKIQKKHSGGGKRKRTTNRASTRASGTRKNSVKMIDKSTFYTEAQSSLLCGQHALNHLVQEKKFISKNSGTTHLLENGQINLQVYCRNVLAAAKVNLGDAASNVISCPRNGNYQADILVKVLKEELQYNVEELPFGKNGIAPLRTILAKPQPNLLGFLINLGESHWVAVNSRIDKGRHIYIDSMDLPSKFKSMTHEEILVHLMRLNPTRIYAIFFPTEGAYYRCRVCA
jgi:8-oxo-dGTP pyrophosphatase MutT (NUDIX family)